MAPTSQKTKSRSNFSDEDTEDSVVNKLLAGGFESAKLAYRESMQSYRSAVLLCDRALRQSLRIHRMRNTHYNPNLLRKLDPPQIVGCQLGRGWINMESGPPLKAG